MAGVVGFRFAQVGASYLYKCVHFEVQTISFLVFGRQVDSHLINNARLRAAVLIKSRLRRKLGGVVFARACAGNRQSLLSIHTSRRGDMAIH